MTQSLAEYCAIFKKKIADKKALLEEFEPSIRDTPDQFLGHCLIKTEPGSIDELESLIVLDLLLQCLSIKKDGNTELTEHRLKTMAKACLDANPKIDKLFEIYSRRLTSEQCFVEKFTLELSIVEEIFEFHKSSQEANKMRF